MSTDKSRVEQKNTLGFAAPPQTPQEQKLEGMVGTGDYSTPIRAGFERARQNNSNSYNNPLGAYTTADVRDKAQREQNFNIDQSEALALGNAANQNQQNAFGQQATVAGLMAPVSYNSGSTKSDKWTGGDTFATALGTGTNLLSSF